MVILGIDFSKNLSLYTVPLAFFVSMMPHTWACVAAGKDYDLAQPRKTTAKVLADEKMEKVKKLRIVRAEAATQNGMETLGFYAAAVVAANAVGLDAGTLNTLTYGYLASRLMYNLAYVRLQDNRAFAPIRSLSWLVGVLLTVTLYVKAGMEVSA